VRVAVYCRVSTDKQELEQQVEACKRFCAYKQMEFELFAEIGSGKTFKRVRFLEMIDRIRKLEFQGVVVFRYDRLGRNAREVVTLFEEFESKGIQLFSLNENIDTSTPAGKMVRDVIIRLAQLERENISAATKQRLQALKSLGKRLGRPPGSPDKKPRQVGGYKARWAAANRDNKGRVRKVAILPLNK
jgi:DNA invertase Pin-like site-specific DNA recombinase